MTWERALRASKLGAEQHNKGRLDMFTSPARFRQGGLFGWRFFKGKIECFVRGGDTFVNFWRVGTVLFCVRGTVGGESVCKGRTKLILCVSLYPAALLAV